MIRKVVGPGRLSVGRCSRSGVRNQRVAPVPVGRLRYTGGVSHLLGYALVSTAEQNADLQTDELTAAGCWRVWTDHASGVLDRRPQLDEVLGQLRRPALQARCRPAPDRPHALRRACAHRRPDRPGPRRQPHLHLQSLGTGNGRGERGRGAANGVHGVSAGERLVTVLVTVAVPEAADPEDAAALVADAAVSNALDVVHAVGVEGHPVSYTHLTLPTIYSV